MGKNGNECFSAGMLTRIAFDDVYIGSFLEKNGNESIKNGNEKTGYL